MKAYIFNQESNRYEAANLGSITFGELDTSILGFLMFDINSIEYYITFLDAKSTLPSNEYIDGYLPLASYLSTVRPRSYYTKFITESQTEISVKQYRKSSSIGFRLKGFPLDTYSSVRLYMINGFTHPLKRDNQGFYLAGAFEVLESRKAHVTCIDFPGVDYYLNTPLTGAMVTSGSFSDTSITITPSDWKTGLIPIVSIAGIMLLPDILGVTVGTDTITIDVTTTRILTKLRSMTDRLALDESLSDGDLFTEVFNRENTFIFWLPVTDLQSTKRYYTISGDSVRQHPNQFDGQPIVANALGRSIDYAFVDYMGKRGTAMLDDELESYFNSEEGISTAGLTVDENKVSLNYTHIGYTVPLDDVTIS